MQSPLSSRRNIRPERVAHDEAFVLVAWRTVMVCPFVSQLRLDPMRSPAGAGGFQAQRMSQFLFFGLQVGERMRRRADLAGKAFDDLDAALAERAHLAWVIGQQPNARNAKVVEDRGGQDEVPEVGLEPERSPRTREPATEACRQVGCATCSDGAADSAPATRWSAPTRRP